jgi:hypothetical protein
MTTTQQHPSLYERLIEVFSVEPGIEVDTDEIFALIEGAMRKHLGLTYQQVDDVLHDVRVEIERLVDEAIGNAVDFDAAVAAAVEEFGS